MKFYLSHNAIGEIIDCFTTLKEAKETAMSENGQVKWVDISVTTESIRRLLSNQGGYANSSGEIREWR